MSNESKQPDERATFEWPAHPRFPTPTIRHANGSGYFTEHQMQGYANAYGEIVRVSLTPPPTERMSEADRECKWTYDLDGEGGFWDTECGEAFCFMTDGPKQNNFAWCCYCGGKLVPTLGDAARKAEIERSGQESEGNRAPIDVHQQANDDAGS
ncbi:hypothetical protein G3N59_10440 [Paraburkholderia sp. Ac-20340]|uniref:hypothetical protein n=1 Tax=Paraburkholderia sp. Ac-20340 TaxID=2703888 RepID=UPI001981686A|nr:hypothetical protein [Paraburkholderia sp. Ac-20340]MBN3853798.1 hypothetical protein [Paraburkholderia sp. Ac-20340]